MGDIAQILGVVAPPNASSLLFGPRNEEDVDDVLALTTATTTKQLPRSVKLQRLPKDVLDLVVGSSNNSNNETSIELPTAIPMMNRRTPAAVVGSNNNNNKSNTANSGVSPLGGEDTTRVVKIGNKWISTNPSVRLWKWLPFTSSARNDGLLLHHWVRHNVEYFDYPYARFNIHLDTVSYSDSTTTTHNNNNNDTTNNTNHHHRNEYRALQLHTDPNWSQSETDLLLELVQRYELRWPVIYDRWIELLGSNTNNNHSSSDNDPENNNDSHQQQQPQQQHRFQMEDLQHRYYTVAAIINQSRITTEAEYEARNLTLQTNAASANLLLVNTVRTNTTNAATSTTATAAGPPSAMEGVTPTTNATNTNINNNNNTDDNENEMMKQRAVETLLIETAAARALATTEPQYQPLIQNIGTGTSNKIVFDLDKERERRQHMEALWNRSKAEELEEIELRKELKQIDVQLRKLKKSGAHIAAAKANSTNHIASTTTTTHQSSSRTATPIQFGSSSGSGNNVPNEAIAVDLTTLPTLLDQAFVSSSTTSTTAGPIAMAGLPYLQSCRLLPPGIGDGATINQALLSRMDTVLDELNIPQNPIATKRVCDVYDTLRRDILTLLILQKEVLQKEGILATKHLHLAKKSGNTHVDDEEALLGIPPPKPSTPSVRAPSSTTTAAAAGGGGGSGKGSRNTKSGKTDGPKRKASTTPKTGTVTMGDTTKKDDSTGGPNHFGKATSGGKQPRKPSVPGTKRKRKSDDSGPKVVVNNDMSIPTGVTATVAATAPLPLSLPGTTVSSSSTIPIGTIPKPTGTDTLSTTKPVTTSTVSTITVNDIGGIAPATATSGSVATTTVATTSTPTESKASAKKRAKKSNT